MQVVSELHNPPWKCFILFPAYVKAAVPPVACAWESSVLPHEEGAEGGKEGAASPAGRSARLRAGSVAGVGWSTSVDLSLTARELGPQCGRRWNPSEMGPNGKF